jgi:hypothetical protein
VVFSITIIVMLYIYFNSNFISFTNVMWSCPSIFEFYFLFFK